MITQGKWYVSEHEDNGDVVVRAGKSQRIVANCEVDFTRDVEQPAYEILDNANLIAAAPDLLDFCKTVQAVADSAPETNHKAGEVVGGNWDILGPMLRKAIAATSS